MKKKVHNTISVMAVLVAAFAVYGCSDSQKSIEEHAAAMLQQSRELLADRKYEEARDTLLSMRQTCPTAIETRKQGILLLDSIEMMAAADSLEKATNSEEHDRLDIKARFFRRKLQEDLK